MCLALDQNACRKQTKRPILSLFLCIKVGNSCSTIKGTPLKRDRNDAMTVPNDRGEL